MSSKMFNFARAKRRAKVARERGVSKRFGVNHNALKTHCPAGHSYDGNNLQLRFRRRGNTKLVERRCRACRALQRHPAKVRR